MSGTCQHTFMMLKWKRGGGILKFVKCLQNFFVFKDLLFNFAGKRVGSHAIGHFL